MSIQVQKENIQSSMLLEPKSTPIQSIIKNPVSGLVISITLVGIFKLIGLFNGYPLEVVIGIILVTWLAVENGGNDVSKGIAPLVASGVKEFGALVYGSVVTMIGGIASAYIATKLLKLFTSGLINSDFTITTMVAVAMATGATLWVALATRFSLPVSTTHAIVGAVVSVGFVAYGAGSVIWENLISKVLVPLIGSPFLGLTIAWALTFIIKYIHLPQAAGKTLTWLSSGTVCFVRAVNDTPKIVGITALVLLGTLEKVDENSLFSLVCLITLAMGFGSLIKGMAVTKLLAHKVTKLDEKSSLSSILTTTTLVMLSSYFGLPVSTTHVSASSIIGSGLKNGPGSINWKTTRDMVLSWIVTLPVAGLIAAMAYYLLHYFMQ